MSGPVAVGSPAPLPAFIRLEHCRRMILAMASTDDAGRAELAHLLRRTGFGATATELDVAVRDGYAATVDRLVAPTGPDVGADATPPPSLTGLGKRPAKDDKAARAAQGKQRRAQQSQLSQWWLERMRRAQQPMVEKMTLLWHNHWATSVQKVREPALMLRQNQTLRHYSLGDFGAFAHTMVRDPALMIWLDAGKNTGKAPNENLGRELMELFTIGVGNFTETDVRQAARALTGWTVDRATGAVHLRERRHDKGSKTVLGHTGDFDDAGLVDVLLGSEHHAPYVVTRLWQRVVSLQTPPPSTLDRLVAAYGPHHDIRALMKAMLLDPVFRSGAARKALVKQPIEYVAGTLHALDVAATSKPREQNVQAGKKKHAGGNLIALLTGLGQTPFAPPSVGGWPPSGPAFLTTAAAQTRLQFAQWVTARADLSVVERAAPAERVDTVAHLLSVDAWTSRTRNALAPLANDPAKLVTFALTSPEYVVA